MTFQLVYSNAVNVSGSRLQLPPLLTTHQIVIDSDTAIRINQEFVLDDLEDVFLPGSRLIASGKNLLNLDNQYPYRLIVRSRDNRTSAQVNLSVWSNPMPLNNPSVQFPSSSATAITSVAAATTNTQLLAANANRKGFSVWNGSNATLFLALGATASVSSYACQIASGGYYEVPFNYQGVVSGIWAATGGSAIVSEFT